MHFFEFLSARSFTLIRKSSVVAIITFCLASAAAAQTTTTITGTVQDSAGATLAGVKVTARHIDTGLSLSVVTAEDGRYVFPAMPVGNYEIRADLSGFRPLLRQGIRLVVGETAIVDSYFRSGRARRNRDGHGRSRARKHADARAELPRRRARDKRASAQRQELHGPRAVAAGRARFPAQGRRVCGRARPRHEHQRPGPEVERLPSGRNASKRFHERPGGQRGKHRARHRSDKGVSRRSKRLRRGVRAQLGRADQCALKVRDERASREPLLLPPQRQFRREEFFRRRAQA